MLSGADKEADGSHAQVASRLPIVHLTSVHPSDDVRILVKECRSLARAGFAVTLIAPIKAGHGESELKLIHFAKPTSRLRRIFGALRMFGAALKVKAKIYHFHDSELIPVGILLKLCGKCVIYDVHESLSAAMLSKHYLPRPLRWLFSGVIGGIEQVGSWCFDTMVCATPAIAAQFPGRRVVLVQNFPILGDIDVSKGADYQSRDQVGCYLGGIERIRGAYEMAEAAKRVSSSRKFRLVLAGDTHEAGLKKKLQENFWGGAVEFVGHVKRDRASEILGTSRMGLVVLHPEPNYLASQATKMFEYMIAGLPVIASDFPLWRRLVEEAGCGLVVNPLAVDEIGRAIEWILDHPSEAAQMGQKGRDYVLRQANWAAEEQKLIQLYRDLQSRYAGSRAGVR